MIGSFRRSRWVRRRYLKDGPPRPRIPENGSVFTRPIDIPPARDTPRATRRNIDHVCNELRESAARRALKDDDPLARQIQESNRQATALPRPERTGPYTGPTKIKAA